MSVASLWYVVRTATRREEAACAGLAEQGFEVYLPHEVRWRRLRVRKVVAARPLFPGYLFVRCAPDQGAQVLDTDGVHQFVRYTRNDGDPVPMPLPAWVIDGIQADEAAGLFDYTRATVDRYRPKANDRVRITGGPWVGFMATVLAAPTSERVKVLADGKFGGRLTLDLAHLSAA